MRVLILDLKYAFRMINTNRGIFAIAVLSLALGMGTASTVFSLVDGMFLRPFPVRDPAGMVWINSRTAEGRKGSMAWLDYMELKGSTQGLSDIAVQSRRGGQLEVQSDPETVMVTVVSDNYFSLLGLQPAWGRLFQADLDAEQSNEPVMAISDSLWHRRFGADPAVIGRSVRMNSRPFTIVGVLPPDFRGLNRGVRNDIWVPVITWKAMGNKKEFEERGSGGFEGIARLQQGMTLEQVQAELNSISRRLQQEYPDTNRGRVLMATTEADRQGSQGANQTTLLLSIVGLVLIISCANVAMLLLAQVEGRNREISIRLAVGANRWRLIRQLLTEGCLLALAGGTLALLVSSWLIPLLPALLPPGPDFVRYDIRMDGRVIGVTMLTCMITVMLFGITPALKAARTDLMSVLKGRGFETKKRYAGRNLLITAQAALSVVLFSSAALMTYSFLHTRQQRLGFDTDKNMLILLAAVQAPKEAIPANCDEITERIGALPGVKKTAYCRRMPLSSSGGGATVDVVIPGRTSSTGEELMRIRYNQISADYLTVAGTKLLSGRAFSAADSTPSTKVALANQTMAGQFWPQGDAVGHWIRVGRTDTQIVGVVEDSVISRVHEAREPFLLFPYAQFPTSEATLLVETAGAAEAQLEAVKREIRSGRSKATVILSATLKQHLRDAMYSDWLQAVLSTVIGVLGMILASAGLFGMVLYGVKQRNREIGIRMALGAQVRSLILLILRHGLLLSGCGAIGGVFASLALGRITSSLLYGISPYDPVILFLSVLAVLALALAASLYPAWKATRVDPILILRTE